MGEWVVERKSFPPFTTNISNPSTSIFRPAYLLLLLLLPIEDLSSSSSSSSSSAAAGQYSIESKVVTKNSSSRTYIRIYG